MRKGKDHLLQEAHHKAEVLACLSSQELLQKTNPLADPLLQT